MITQERREELKKYIKTLCQIYYKKAGDFYRDPALRRLIDKAKMDLKHSGVSTK